MDTDNTTPPFGLEPLLDVIELAAYLGVPVSTVYDWRTNGKGPRAFRFGKRLKFAVSDVQVWIGQHRDPMHPAVPFAGKHGARPDVSDQAACIHCALADIVRRPRTIQQPPTF